MPDGNDNSTYGDSSGSAIPAEERRDCVENTARQLPAGTVCDHHSYK